MVIIHPLLCKFFHRTCNGKTFVFSHMSETLKAVYDDGCIVIGYTVWTLLYNMEWTSGYT